MKLYLTLGANDLPLSPYLSTKADVEEMKRSSLSKKWAFYPVKCPWEDTRWSRSGGAGISAYPKDMEQTTIRVPKDIAYQVQQYAVWLATQKESSVETADGEVQ